MPSVAHIVRRRQARKARRDAQRRRSSIWMLAAAIAALTLVIAPLAATVGLAAWLYARAANHFPPPAKTLYLDPIIGVTRLLDRSGNTLIYAVEDALGSQRRWLELEDLPQYAIDAALLAEDPDYLTTANFDAIHTLSQLWRYILGLPIETESSITAKLARNAMLPLARASGLDESLLEIALTAESHRLLPPEERLEWHLNTNDYGNDTYGLEAAAQVYLGKSAEALRLDEAALLAAMTANPQLNPFDNPLAAREGQADLLLNMFTSGLIDSSQYDQAAAVQTATARGVRQRPQIAPEFAAYARRQAQDILDREGLDGARLVSRGALKIVTTLDLDLYLQSECVIRAHLDRLRGGSGDVQTLDDSPCAGALGLTPPRAVDASLAPDAAVLMMMDVTSGEILSMVGEASRQAHQPAALLHPFVYMEGFLRRAFTPASMVYDIPRAFPGPADGLIYAPANPDGRFRGPLNLRDAMAGGLLPPAAQIASSQGLSQIIRTAHQIGLKGLDDDQYTLDILARGGEISALDATYAYSVLAAMGVMRGVAEPAASGYRGRNPLAVRRIADAQGRILWEHDAESSQTVIFEPSLAYLVNDILADHEARQRVLGGVQALRLPRPAAVVNGLSADSRGSWTLGYTPHIILGLHLGRGDEAAMSIDDQQGSAPIWQALMNYVHERNNLPAENWPRPADIEEYQVCDISGLIPAAGNACPTRREIVPAGSPLRTDTYWQTYEINVQTGQLATADTPADLRTEKVYFVPPDDVLEWWTQNGQPLPPSQYDAIRPAAGRQAAQIDRPADFAYARGAVDIRGRLNGPPGAAVQLAYGPGVNPREWTQIDAQLTERTIAASWDTTALNGVYTLKLTAAFSDGGSDADTKLITLDNTAPSIDLRTSDGSAIIEYPAQTVVSLAAAASDNLTVERVEFYQNDALLGVDREWPYGFEYDIQGAGTEIFSARVFDQVGNNAQVDLTVQIVSSP